MEHPSEQPKTFRDFYDKLLNPSPAFDNRGRHEKCYRDWCAMDEAERQGIYHIIEEALSNDDYVDPNPCFAMNNAMQEYEKRLAKSKAKPHKEPENLNGKRKIDSVLKQTRVVSAVYRGHPGIYTLAEAEQFGMVINYGMNFDWDAYRAQMTTK